jgi:hypothetical protein
MDASTYRRRSKSTVTPTLTARLLATSIDASRSTATDMTRLAGTAGLADTVRPASWSRCRFIDASRLRSTLRLTSTSASTFRLTVTPTLRLAATPMLRLTSTQYHDDGIRLKTFF